MERMALSWLKDLRPVTVKVFDAEEVTTRSHREVDPRAVGMRPEDIEAIWAAVVQYYKLGLHPALALCIRRRGEVVLDRAIGHARGNSPEDPAGAPLVKATPETLYNMFSGSKCVTAMLVQLLHEEELLHVDEPVATFIPEFAKKRKQSITVRDILTHRAGIPALPTEAAELSLLSKPGEIVSSFCELEPAHSPGSVSAYHAVTGGFVLAEIVRRVTGKSLQEFLRVRVREPLGLKNFAYGVPPELLDQVAIEAFTGPAPTWPAKQLIDHAFGLSMQQIVAIGNDPRFRTAVVPSGNIIGTPEEICRFFELLLCGGTYQGTRIFSSRTVERATRPQGDPTFDRTLKVPVHYSQGFMLGNRAFSFFGPRTQKAFGHLGFTNVLTWADPERDISVAFLNTGKPLVSAKMLGWFNVLRVLGHRISRDRA